MQKIAGEVDQRDIGQVLFCFFAENNFAESQIMHKLPRAHEFSLLKMFDHG